jgi:WD40 repeat protein
VSFSPDGTRLATASDDGTARVWDARTGQELLVVTDQDPSGLWAVAFSPDGTRLATKARRVGGQARLWDARTGQELPGTPDFPLSEPGNNASPDGKRLALRQGHRVVLVDIHKPSEVELASRLWATRSDRSWHDDEVERLGRGAPPSAIAFHRALAAGLHPAAVSDLRYAIALIRSKRCPDAALALLRAAATMPEDDAYPPAPLP